MKSASFTRPIDEMGRFVLPIEIRRALDLQDKDRLEIYIEGFEGGKPFMIAVYENNEEYSKLDEYKLSKGEKP